MKIGIVCYPTYGGSGIVATELGMELAKQGHQIHFISYSLPARLDVTLQNITFHQVNVDQYPLFEYQPYSLALSTQIVKIATSYGLDLLHVHYAIPHAYAAYFAKQILKDQGISLPVVTTLHGTDITLVGHRPAYKSAVEFSINHSDAVTAVSQDLKNQTHKIFNIKKEIFVVPNFIDLSLFDSSKQCQRKNFASDHEKILIHVSNLRPVKRLRDVIKVFYEVQKEIPCKLIVVGEGPDWELAQELINQLKISDKIIALGKVQKLYDILCLSDVFLLPSEHESFGLAALEAMAAHTPVVSSDTGGLKEVNENGITGFTCPIGNIDAMKNACLKLLKDDDLLEKFKINARKRAEEFDMYKIIPLYVDIYRKLENKNSFF